jgi:hypothetical protein
VPWRIKPDRDAHGLSLALFGLRRAGEKLGVTDNFGDDLTAFCHPVPAVARGVEQVWRIGL